MFDVYVYVVVSGKAEDDVDEQETTRLARKRKGVEKKTKRQGAAPGLAYEAFDDGLML